MDFKSLMAAQISKAKGATNGAGPTSKYQRRADFEAERQAAYAAEQAKLEADQEERAAKRRRLEEESADKTAEREAVLKRLAAESKLRREAQQKEEERARRKRLGLPELPDPDTGEQADALADDEEDIDEDQLRAKLRSLDHPAALFDESHTARLKRYYKLIRKSLGPKLSHGPIPTTLELVEEKDMLLPQQIPKPDTPEHQFLYRQLASYFTLLLTEWSRDLNARDEEVKESSTGRAALQSHLNVIGDLTPLFRKLESRTLAPDLLPPLCEIVSHAQHRKYVKANDAYLTLSIGKAAWPIGVTMVGIHERSAREKLHEQDKQAHIMSDEVTRKMLQSVKRCLSYAQTRWPPTDLGQLMG
jgi:pre-mRNA-splicing factor 18